MGLAVATITGLVIWIVLWSLGVKSVDAFLITILIVVVAATARRDHFASTFAGGIELSGGRVVVRRRRVR